MTPAPDDAQRLAHAVRDHLLAGDTASRGLGMTVLEVGPGTATVTMTVRADMLNGVGTCHGGLVASLADSAFAFACNAQGDTTVAAGFDIEFVAPARLGDELVARAVEASKAGRLGVYDVDVRRQGGERVALFRGRSYTMKGRPLLPAGSDAAPSLEG